MTKSKENRRRPAPRAEDNAGIRFARNVCYSAFAMTALLVVLGAAKNPDLVWGTKTAPKEDPVVAERNVFSSLLSFRQATDEGRGPLEVAFAKASKVSGIPAAFFRKLAEQESGPSPDPGAINRKTGACGIYQFLPKTTLLEVVYKFADDYPEYAHLQKHVRRLSIERKDGKGKGTGVFDYVYQSNGWRSKQALLEACLDPAFSATMAGRYHRQYLPKLAERIDVEELTFADARLMHLLGPEDAGKVISGYRDGKTDTPVTRYVPRAVAEQNAPTLMNGKNPATVGEVYARVTATMEP